METPKRYLPRLAGLSLGVLLALWIWPATRWLIRSQFALATPIYSAIAPSCPAGPVCPESAPYLRQATQETPNSPHYFAKALEETAAQHPDNYLFQLAAVVTVNAAKEPLTSVTKVDRLRALEARFPNRPSLYANILRYATQDQVVIHRDEPAMLTGEPAPQLGTDRQTQSSTPEPLAAFDRDAAEGERLDSDNAYFPLMRAVGLFAAHRDDDALAALSRAAQKPVWAEYYNDEVEGEWLLQEAALGHTSALSREVLAFSLPLPHYHALRAASRIAVFKAVEAEQAGHIEEGLAIRRAVQHCASLMRAQSPCALGSVVGISLFSDSLLRPGGTPARRSGSSAQPAQVIREQRIRDFDAYLRRIGHSAESAGLYAEIAAGQQARQILRLSMDRDPLGPTSLLTLCAWWIADLLLLSNALWMLLLSGAAALLRQHPRIRSGKGLSTYARRGCALGILASGILAALAVVHNALPGPGTWLVLALVCGTLALILPGLSRAEKLRSLGVFGVTLAVLGGLGAAYFRQTAGVLGGIMPVIQLVQINMDGAKGADLTRALLPLLLGSGIVVPFLLLLTLGILSLKWRVPLSVGLSRGLRGSAVPITCALVLVYAVLVPLTMRQESVSDKGLKRWIVHEGRYLAESIGKTWPGPTL